MRLLIDTNIFIYLAVDQDSLSKDVRALLEDYDNNVCMSVESLRELVVLYNNGGIVSKVWKSSHEMLKSLDSDYLLENLLPNCKVLNINTPKKQKVPKETNWKQKFQKPQNENICLTYLNTEMNGNFHFLSFCAAFLKVQNQVL